MIEIDQMEPNKSVCDCCNGETTNLTRFVHQDGEPIAMYYAVFSDDHPECSVTGIISIGDWSSVKVETERIAFPFRLWIHEDNFQVGITDKEESPWKNVGIVGNVLDREEALTHPLIDEVFHITDHIVVQDVEIVRFFENTAGAVN